VAFYTKLFTFSGALPLIHSPGALPLASLPLSIPLGPTSFGLMGDLDWSLFMRYLLAFWVKFPMSIFIRQKVPWPNDKFTFWRIKMNSRNFTQNVHDKVISTPKTQNHVQANGQSNDSVQISTPTSPKSLNWFWRNLRFRAIPKTSYTKFNLDPTTQMAWANTNFVKVRSLSWCLLLVYLSDAHVSLVDQFWRSVRHMTCFHTKICLIWVWLTLRPTIHRNPS